MEALRSFRYVQPDSNSQLTEQARSGLKPSVNFRTDRASPIRTPVEGQHLRTVRCIGSTWVQSKGVHSRRSVSPRYSDSVRESRFTPPAWRLKLQVPPEQARSTPGHLTALHRPSKPVRHFIAAISPPAPSEQARPIQGSKSHLAAPLEQARSAQSSDLTSPHRPGEPVQHSPVILASPHRPGKPVQHSPAMAPRPHRPGKPVRHSPANPHYIRTARASPFGTVQRILTTSAPLEQARSAPT